MVRSSREQRKVAKFIFSEMDLVSKVETEKKKMMNLRDLNILLVILGLDTS